VSLTSSLLLSKGTTSMLPQVPPGLCASAVLVAPFGVLAPRAAAAQRSVEILADFAMEQVRISDPYYVNAFTKDLEGSLTPMVRASGDASTGCAYRAAAAPRESHPMAWVLSLGLAALYQRRRRSI
jgi:MYXO-CTERM domain-containing protein